MQLALKGMLRQCGHLFMAEGSRMIWETHRHRVAGNPARVGWRTWTVRVADDVGVGQTHALDRQRAR